MIEFIKEHINDNCKDLMLKKPKNCKFDYQEAVNQILARQIAKKKIPSWAENFELIFPKHLNMEQCSSEKTAIYKQNLIEKNSNIFIDLTGGLGVDFFFMSQNCQQKIYVEQNSELCQIAQNNFEKLELKNYQIINQDCIEFLKTCPNADYIFIDPARRDQNLNKTYAIKDCSPNLIEILDLILSKTKKLIIKLSSMLDINKSIIELKNHIKEIHVISINNDCKELLLIVENNTFKEAQKYIAVNNDDIFEVKNTEFCKQIEYVLPQENNYLYLPNASIMKLGLFGNLCQKYKVKAIGKNSHLFVSKEIINDFPGRKFLINNITKVDKKEVSKIIKNKQANIATRNFPLSAQELKQKLGLKDGGEFYIFGTTITEEKKVLIICKKI